MAALTDRYRRQGDAPGGVLLRPALLCACIAASGGWAGVATAEPQDIDLRNCEKVPELVLPVTEGNPVDLRIRVLNNERGNVFWGFLNVPVSISGGASCSEKIPGASFECGGVAISLPPGAPDESVPSEASAELRGTGGAPGSFRFKLLVTSKGEVALTCERSYLLAITEKNPDVLAPSTPEGLTVREDVPSTRLGVIVQWQAATDDHGVKGYLLERCEGEGCSTFSLRARPSSSTRFVDRRVTEDTEYTYRVRAIDSAGNRSAPSNQATVRTSFSPPDHHPE